MYEFEVEDLERTLKDFEIAAGGIERFDNSLDTCIEKEGSRHHDLSGVR